MTHEPARRLCSAAPYVWSVSMDIDEEQHSWRVTKSLAKEELLGHHGCADVLAFLIFDHLLAVAHIEKLGDCQQLSLGGL